MTGADRIRSGQAPASPFRRSSGRVAYPHRVSLDLSGEQYAWLRAAAYEARVPAAALVRAALDQLAGNAKLHAKVVAGAQAEFPPPPASR